MNEDYVSLEVAKLLKDNGFDWFCAKNYIENDKPDGEVLAFVGFIYYKKPTLYMAQKWLREERNIEVVIDFKSKDSWYYRIYDLDENDFIEQSEEYFNTYEKALDAGMLEALKLI